MTFYNTYDMCNTQEELQKLAEDILAYGTVREIVHNGYSTNRVTTKDGKMRYIRNGNICYLVDGFKAHYTIHMHGLRVTEIIESFAAGGHIED